MVDEEVYMKVKVKVLPSFWILCCVIKTEQHESSKILLSSDGNESDIFTISENDEDDIFEDDDEYNEEFW